MNFGCKCDYGYTGANCDYRMCKQGYDPVYFNPDSSYRYSNWSYAIIIKSSTASIIGNYSIVFYDYTGKGWMSELIPYNASCTAVVNTLENIPNNVIPRNSVRCHRDIDFHNLKNEPVLGSSYDYYGLKYTLAFPRNPGKLKQIKIERYLDGSRPSLYDNTPSTAASSSSPISSALQIPIYANGYSGENIEYFTSQCHSVDVTLKSTLTYNYLSGITDLEFRLLSKCLSDVDGLTSSISATGRVEGSDYTWDYGTNFNPHMIRLVDKTLHPVSNLCVPVHTPDQESNPNHDPNYKYNSYSHDMKENFQRNYDNNNENDNKYNKENNNEDLCTDKPPPGFYVAIYYDPILQLFVLLNRPASDYSSTTLFSVFTTSGTATIVSEYSKIYTDIDIPYSRTVYTTNSTSNYTGYYGNIDCESNKALVNGALGCIDKGDKVFFLNPFSNEYSFQSNPMYINLYSVDKISSDRGVGSTILLDMGMNAGWSSSSSSNSMGSEARAYQFLPPVDGYDYVAPCANRGICNAESGQCKCFEGFEGDSCEVIYNTIKNVDTSKLIF